MTEKQLAWAGSSLKDLLDDDIFSLDARKVAGQQLRKVQRGDELRIPAQAGRQFQPKLDSNSKASWTLIPA
ncbi:MAG: hypothetical protein RLZZ298_2076 [Pseudomonadota bacterium]|jgi:phage-related protein